MHLAAVRGFEQTRVAGCLEVRSLGALLGCLAHDAQRIGRLAGQPVRNAGLYGPGSAVASMTTLPLAPVGFPTSFAPGRRPSNLVDTEVSGS